MMGFKPSSLVTAGVFVAMYAAFAVLYPAMLSPRVFANLLTDSAYLGILAVGMLVVVVSGVLLWGFTTEPFDPWSLLVALLAYLLARVTWWAAHLPLRGRAEVAALRVGWRRDLAVLGGTGLLGGLAMLVSGATLQGAVLLAALAVAGLALVALATGGPARHDGRD